MYYSRPSVPLAVNAYYDNLHSSRPCFFLLLKILKSEACASPTRSPYPRIGVESPVSVEESQRNARREKGRRRTKKEQETRQTQQFAILGELERIPFWVKGAFERGSIRRRIDPIDRLPGRERLFCSFESVYPRNGFLSIAMNLRQTEER
jgi:hypothetical protein